MFTIYNEMQKRAIPDFKLENLNSLVNSFREETNTFRKNQIYATVFTSLFPMMLKISKRFYSLSNEEKVEHCMCLLLSLMNNHYDKQKKVKFSTYFYQSLENGFRTQVTSKLTNKRKVWENISDSYDKEIIKLSRKAMPKNDLDLVKNLKENDRLSELEKDYCTCVIAGYKTKEIANKMQLATKIGKMSMDNPLYEKTNIKLVNNIRLKLKKRFMSNKYDLIN